MTDVPQIKSGGQGNETKPPIGKSNEFNWGNRTVRHIDDNANNPDLIEMVKRIPNLT